MRRARYWRDIAMVVSLKALALGVLYLLFFTPSSRIEPDAAAMFQHLAAPAAATAETAHD
jgi:type II secretory pathway component PulM